MAGSESLFDALAGAAGHPVNRPALNAYITQGQAQAGLRSAQTIEAMVNAENGRREQAAQDGLENNLTDMYVKQGQDYATAAASAKAMSGVMRSHYGNYQQAASGALEMLKTQAGAKLLDPNTPPDAAIRADQVLNPGANPYQVDQGQLIPRMQQNGQSGPPTVFQTPGSQATQAAQLANANLHNAKAAAPAGGTSDENAIAFGAYKLYKTGQMPALGMGGGPAKMAMLAGAAELSRREAAGEDVSNPGFDHALANGQDFTAGGKALGSFAAGPLGNQTRALNNVVGHLKLYDNMLTALDSGDVQLINKASSVWKKAFGSEAPTNLQAAGTLIGPELTKIMTNSQAGSQEERTNFLHQAGSLSNSPEQGHGAIRTLTGMLGRQAGDLAIQYHGATGRGDFAKRYLNPDVAGYLGLGPETGEQEAPSGATGPGTGITTQPTVLPHAAVLQLKEGFKTTFGNGQTWTLKNGQPVQVAQ